TVCPSAVVSRCKTYSTAITCLQAAFLNSKSGHVHFGACGSGFTLYSPWPTCDGTIQVSPLRVSLEVAAIWSPLIWRSESCLSVIVFPCLLVGRWLTMNVLEIQRE